MATIDWFNDGPNSGLGGTIGGLPAWQIVDYRMKKLMVKGDSYPLRGMRSTT
jgi:hypothetical protein